MFDAKPCLNKFELKCASIVYDRFIQEDEQKICNNFCASECDSYKFDIQKSESDFPTESYSQVLLGNEVVKLHFNNRTNITAQEIK